MDVRFKLIFLKKIFHVISEWGSELIDYTLSNNVQKCAGFYLTTW